MRSKRANRNSWTIDTEFSLEREEVLFDKVYTQAEFKKIQRGYIPNELEDPWFLYVEENTLFVHANDGVGKCLYQVIFEKDGSDYVVKEAWASRDPNQAQPSQNLQLLGFAKLYNRGQGPVAETSADVEILTYLIDHWLIQRPWRR